jgi:hypothetical protein
MSLAAGITKKGISANLRVANGIQTHGVAAGVKSRVAGTSGTIRVHALIPAMLMIAYGRRNPSARRQGAGSLTTPTRVLVSTTRTVSTVSGKTHGALSIMPDVPSMMATKEAAWTPGTAGGII